MSILQQIKQIAQNDIRDIINSLEYQLKIKFKLDKIEYGCNEEALEHGNEEEECRVRVRLVSGVNTLPFIMVYTYDGENIYANKELRDIIEHIVKKFRKAHDIKSATVIMAADGDDDFFVDDSEGVLYEDDDTVGDNIDDLADQVDDLQEAVEGNDPEDEVAIEIDNNIADHYIAECDRCHGIFISAMIESDQKVEKISGTCPLCEKESDQYLRWVVKSATDTDK